VKLRKLFGFQPGDAICYSGYREGQSPVTGSYPSLAEVREDLRLLAPHWRLLRLYDCGRHAELVLQAIRDERLDLKIMLGVSLEAEVSNPGCPWGGTYPEAQLAANRAGNEAQVEQAIRLARRHPDLVFAVSAGNEATVGWTDHLVPQERVVGYVRRLKAALPQPITFCENYVPWQGQLDDLAAEVDFISLHTYPVWELKGIGEAMDYTVENYRSVASRHPDKPVVITEAGWTTRSDGRGIHPENASPALQATYLEALTRWSRSQGILTFVFEAFDEPWKGGPHPDEPEKHWGLFAVDRRPKPAMAARLRRLAQGSAA
jgi:exo-beta-1,3-glucanase (GH17 family)